MIIMNLIAFALTITLIQDAPTIDTSSSSDPPPSGGVSQIGPAFGDRLHWLDAPTFEKQHSIPDDPCQSKDAPTFGCHGDDEDQARVWVNAAFDQPADRAQAVRTADCESRFRTDAKNPNSSASGLFQHLASLWVARTQRAFGTVLDIWNGWHSTVMAAWLVELDGWWHWPRCGKA